MKVGAGIGLAFGLNEIKNFTAGVIDAGSKVENARTGLTTLLRDSDAAARVIQNTMEDAMRTPLGFEGLLNANKALISANVNAEEARQTVLDLANAISATGGGDDELNRMVVNLQQIKNVGKASAADIKQFAFAGINIYGILAEATGKHTKDVQDMEVTYDMLTYALKKAHEAGGLYANGLENMSKNTSVQISNVEDSIFQLKVRMFNDLKPAFDAMISTAADFVQMLGEAWDWSVRNRDLLKDIAITLGIAAAAWVAYKGVMLASLVITKASVLWETIQYASITLLGDGMLTASAATKTLAGMQVLLNAAFAANPIGLIITGLAALAAAVTWAYNRLGWFRGGLWALWAVIKEFGSIIVDYFKGLYHIITGTLTLDLDTVKKGWGELESATFGAYKRIGEAATRGYKEGIADFEKDKKEEEKVGTPKTLAPIGKGGGQTPQQVTTDTGTSKVTGTKSYTINIKIDNLIRDFQIKTTNLTEGATKVKEVVTQALLSAVNDSQIVAGQ